MNNKLIIFFSLTGNNKKIANDLAQKEECEVLEFALEGKNKASQYFFSKKELTKKANQASNQISDFEEYYVCGPIWGGKPASPIRILLDSMNLQGKNISCFFTYTAEADEDLERQKKKLQLKLEKKLGIVRTIKFRKIEK